MKALEQEFTCDNLTLRGILHLPDQKNPPLIIGSHGLEGSLHSAKQSQLARLLPAHGMAFFRFDHRGCGKSQGNFITDTSLEKRTRDFLAATAHAMGLGLTGKRLGIFGSSMGGATCINAWEGLSAMGLEPWGAVLCAAPVKSLTIENIPQEATENRPALPLSFFEENLVFDLRPQACDLHHLLIFHGDADEVVPLSNGQLLYKTAGEPKKLVVQKGCGHRMEAKADQEEFENRTLNWFKNLFKA